MRHETSLSGTWYGEWCKGERERTKTITSGIQGEAEFAAGSAGDEPIVRAIVGHSWRAISEMVDRASVRCNVTYRKQMPCLW